MKKLILDKNFLSLPCDKVSVQEGLQIAELLREEFCLHEAAGIAANQIGIQKSVCLIDLGREIILINPEIIKAEGEVTYVEGCLSFPDQVVLTQRFANIIVKATNHAGELHFSTENLLECVCVQHEVDHLNGITMFDRQYKG